MRELRQEATRAGFPRGWYVVARSSDLLSAQVRTVQCFGSEIVLYRSFEGVLHAVSPYCPHLGAHLGEGTVEDACLRCPFHGWLFDGLGTCVEIPYSGRTPPSASLRSWPVCERGGYAFLWYSAEGVAPDWHVPGWEDEGWTGPMEREYTFRSTPEEVMENSVDGAHVIELHGGREPRYLKEFEAKGPWAEVRLAFLARGDGLGTSGWVPVELHFRLHGLGYLVLDTTSPGLPIRGRTRFCVTPLDQDEVLVWVINRLETLPGVEMASLEERFLAAVLRDFEKDVAVWSRKIHLERPIVVEGDGPIWPFRRWAAQFRREAGGGSLIEQ